MPLRRIVSSGYANHAIKDKTMCIPFCAQHFPLPTANLASLSLSPTGDALAVWEGALEVRCI